MFESFQAHITLDLSAAVSCGNSMAAVRLGDRPSRADPLDRQWLTNRNSPSRVHCASTEEIDYRQ
jgi:hypothetical protein